MGGMSELMAKILSASIDNFSREDIVRIAYDILLDVNKVSKTTGYRTQEEKAVTYMLFYYVVRMMPKPVKLWEAGVLVAKVEGRRKPYHHASVLHSIKKHNQRIEGGKRFGYELYCENFKSFCNRLAMVRPVLSEDLDEYGQQIMNKTNGNPTNSIQSK